MRPTRLVAEPLHRAGKGHPQPYGYPGQWLPAYDSRMAASKNPPERAGTVTEQVLLEGAWYALAQAGRLLNSATTLYVANDWSTALAVAMFGREEVGRSRLLRDCAREVREGRTLTAHDVRKRSDDHVEKQSASAFSAVLRPRMDSALGKALVTLSQCDPSSKEWQDANILVESATNAKQKNQSQQRHESRCNALYVDLSAYATRWYRPTDISKDDAREGISQAVNDYGLERERFINSQLAITVPPHVSRDEMLAARERMSDPVDLPAPMWFGLGI